MDFGKQIAPEVSPRCAIICGGLGVPLPTAQEVKQKILVHEAQNWKLFPSRIVY